MGLGPEAIGQDEGEVTRVGPCVEAGGAAGKLDDVDRRIIPRRHGPDDPSDRRAPSDPDRLSASEAAVHDIGPQPGDGRVTPISLGDDAAMDEEPVLERSSQGAVLGRRITELDPDDALGHGFIDEPGDPEPGDAQPAGDLHLGQLAIEEQPGNLAGQA